MPVLPCYPEITLKITVNYLLLFAVFCFLLSPYAGAAKEVPGDSRAFLRKYLKLSGSEVNAVESGDVVAKTLGTNRSSEIAVLGIVRLDAAPELLVEKFQDIVTFKKSESVLQIGKFSSEPVLADLKSLTLDQSDLDSLRNCEPGDCGFKLPEAAMERFRKEVKWSAADSRKQAEQVFREFLLGCVESYSRRGSEALSPYADKKKRISLSAEFTTLLKQSPYLSDHLPDFYQYLADYPKINHDHITDFFYWSKEKFSVKPVITVTHVSIYQRPELQYAPVVIASKQIYASHYFNASLGLTAVLKRPGQNPAAGYYLLYLNRSSSDALGGILGGLARTLVRRGSKNAVEKNIALIRQKLEREQKK